MARNLNEVNNSLWSKFVEGLKEKPAYLLIFGITALFFLAGIGSMIGSIVQKNNVGIITGGVVAVVALLISAYVVRIVEEPAYKTYYKSGPLKRKWSAGTVIEPRKVERQAEELLLKLMVEGDLSLGLSYKDPTSKIVMTHTAAGDYVERDRMADIMASFIRAKQASTSGLEFTKVAIPKSGNVLFSIKVAEKLRTEIVAFRGESYPIAQDEHLDLRNNYFDGKLEDDDKIIIVDDVTFRGNTVMDTLKWLKNANVTTKAVFVLAAHEQHVENIRSVLHDTYRGTQFYPIITI